MKKRMLCSGTLLVLALSFGLMFSACTNGGKSGESDSIYNSGLVGTWVYEYEWFVDDPAVLFSTNTDPHYEKIFEMLIIEPSDEEENTLAIARYRASITATDLRIDLESNQSSIIRYNHTITGRIKDDPVTYNVQIGNKYSTMRRELIMNDANSLTVDFYDTSVSQPYVFSKSTMSLNEWKYNVNEYRNNKIEEWGYSHYIPN